MGGKAGQTRRSKLLLELKKSEILMKNDIFKEKGGKTMEIKVTILGTLSSKQVQLNSVGLPLGKHEQ